MPYQPHPEIVKKRWEFQQGYKHGRKCWNRYFVMYVHRNHFNAVRLGITVSKKVGKSVKRNRVKRLIREFFRGTRHRIVLGYDIIIVGRSSATALKYQQAHDALLHLFRKSKILNQRDSRIDGRQS